jgi:SAM-dependent methyltransferase
MIGPASLEPSEGLTFPILVEGLGLSLHYGLFRPGDPATASLEALCAAQGRFVERMVEMVPEGTRTLLDVGTGTGDIAAAIARRGVEVTTISPDPNQGRWVRPLLGPKLRFIRSSFETLALAGPVDSVLFSESANYLALDVLFGRCRDLVRPGGHLIIAAPFALRPHPAFADLHEVAALESAARRAGWRCEVNLDLTAEAAPTLELGRAFLERRVQPTVRLILDHARHRASWRLRGLAALLGPVARRLERSLFETLPARLDADAFRRHVRFLFLRFVPGQGAAQG